MKNIVLILLVGAVAVIALVYLSPTPNAQVSRSQSFSSDGSLAMPTPTIRAADGRAGPGTPLASGSSHHVTYRVVTLPPCSDFAVTYKVPDGTAQNDAWVCPDKNVIHTFTAQTGDFLYLSAQNQWRPENRKKFSCQILVDGRIVAEVESIGFASIASCEGLVP